MTTRIEPLIKARRRLLGGNLSIAYEKPLNIVRGEMQFVTWLQNWTGPKDMNVFVYRMH